MRPCGGIGIHNRLKICRLKGLRVRVSPGLLKIQDDKKMNDFEQHSGDRLFEKIMIGIGVIVVIIALFGL